jgi:hypothetical protein
MRSLVATKGMIPTSSRDLSIIMSLEVRFVKEKRTEERDWLVGRGRRGEVKDAARQLGPLGFCFVLFGRHRSWKLKLLYPFIVY